MVHSGQWISWRLRLGSLHKNEGIAHPQWTRVLATPKSYIVWDMTIPKMGFIWPGSWWWMAATSFLAFRPVEVRLVANVDLSWWKVCRDLFQQTWKFGSLWKLSHGNLRVHPPPQCHVWPYFKGLWSPPSSPNKALLRPYFLRGWHWGGAALHFHECQAPSQVSLQNQRCQRNLHGKISSSDFQKRNSWSLLKEIFEQNWKTPKGKELHSPGHPKRKVVFRQIITDYNYQELYSFQGW